MKKSAGAAAAEIVEVLASSKKSVRVGDLAKATGLSRQEIEAGLQELDGCVSAEPDAFMHRVTKADREAAPVIGGEARHVLKWR